MERLQGLAREALTWPFLVDRQRLIWASVLEFDAVPVEDLYLETCCLPYNICSTVALITSSCRSCHLGSWSNKTSAAEV